MLNAVEMPPEGYSLIKAVYQRRLRLTRLLIDGGAYVNESNSRGETPLMIACMTDHTDLQSASKAKMVKYLLDNKADPNIQDKSGKTALMHACLGRAGSDVVSLLLKSGADPILTDHHDCSALVYAVNTADRDILDMLLRACKGRGKEVVFITIDRLASAGQGTRQYLNVPPPELGECHYIATSSFPLERDLYEAPPESFSLRGVYPPRYPGSPYQTMSLTPKPSPARVQLTLPQEQPLQCEPWVTCCPAVVHQKIVTSSQDLQSATPTEQASGTASGLGSSKRLNAIPPSAGREDTAQVLKTPSQTGLGKLSPNKINYQTPFLEEKHNPTVIPMGRSVNLGNITFFSTLGGFGRNKNKKANQESSNSQLTARLSPAAADNNQSATRKKDTLSPSQFLLPNSREVLEKTPPVVVRSRNQTFPEVQGAEAIPLQQIRPGLLPPVNVSPHHPVQDTTGINTVSGMVACGQTPLGAAAPAFPTMTKNSNLLRKPYEQITAI